MNKPSITVSLILLTLSLTWSNCFSEETQKASLHPYESSCEQAYKPDTLKNFGPYRVRYVKRVMDHWHIAEDYTGLKPILYMSILKSGELEKVEIKKTSGNPDLDKQAIEAFHAASPFEPLPNDFPLSKLEGVVSYEVFHYFNEHPGYDQPPVAPQYQSASKKWLKKVARAATIRWNPLHWTSPSQSIIVSLKLHTRTGEVLEKFLLYSSCDEKLDQLALKTRAHPVSNALK